MHSYEPNTEQQLADALAQRLITEDHFTDFKRDIPHGERGNRSLAEDIAAFCVDGGRIYVGVDEDTDPPSLEPVDAQGLGQRIDQVALSRVDPPVRVRVKIIPAARAEGLGYVVITVVPSPEAPHMVDGRYLGRGDTSNRTLPNAEVVRLHSAQRESTRRIRDLLDGEIARDPVPPAQRDAGHVFIVAEPVTAGPRLLYERLLPSRMKDWIYEFFVPTVAKAATTPWEPRVSQSCAVSRRGDWGYGIHYDGICADRSVRTSGTGSASEAGLLDLEIGEGGGLRLFCGRGTARRGAEGPTVVPDGLLQDLLRQVIAGAQLVAAASAYLGSWDVGFAVTRLQGSHAYSLYQGLGSTYGPYSYARDDYCATLRTTYERLVADSEGVVHDLYAPLARGLNTAD